MARRRNVLETGEFKDKGSEARICAPELRDLPKRITWAEHPELKAEIEEIWRNYLTALSRPVVDLPKAKAISAFEKAMRKTDAFRREVVHNRLLSKDSNERLALRAAAIGALVSAGAKNGTDKAHSFRALDAALQQAGEAVHTVDMALGEILQALQDAEATDYTDAELHNIARSRVGDALKAHGLEATTDRNGLLVLILMQLEGRDSDDAGEDEKQRRYLSSELSKVLREDL